MSTAFFIVPFLHRAAVSAALAVVPPPQAVFFPVGLPAPPDGANNNSLAPAAALAAESASAAALPLSPAEAGAALRDLQNLGREYARDGLLRRLAAESAAARLAPTPAASGAIERAEAADLAAFAANGRLPGAASVRVTDWAKKAQSAPEPQAVRKALEDCQKVLLLIHALEERALELAGLEARFQEAESGLLAALGEEESPLFPPAPDGPTQEALFPVVPWRVAVDAALPFLPEGAALFTADAGMALDLREAGMLQPLPGDRAPALEGWPDVLRNGLLYAAVPAWRLVGRKSVPPERPWLEREVEVFAARPAKGWAQPAPDADGGIRGGA